MTFTHYSIRINGIEVAVAFTLAEAKAMTAEVGEYVLCFEEKPHRLWLNNDSELAYEVSLTDTARKFFEYIYG